MADTPTEFSGHCSCGGITYHATAAPVMQGVCHCTDCQRQTGTAFSIVIGVPRDALTIEGDTLSSYTTIGDVHQTPTERKFCSGCGSPIASFVEGMPDLAWIKAGTLDDASWLKPAFEIFVRSAQPWAPHIEGVPQLRTAPG
jgi:hypothetical protein